MLPQHADGGNLICVDVDGPLIGPDGQPVKGAAEAIQQLHQMGFQVVAWTSATGPQADADRTRLATAGIAVSDFLENKKPPALAYIDDRAIHFDGDWPGIVARFTARHDGAQPGKLHMLIGLPGSGKSTFSQKAIPGAARVAHDALVGAITTTITGVDRDFAQRLANDAEQAIVRAALRGGRDVVLDRLNLTAGHRARWIELARECQATVHGYCWRLGLERQWAGNLARVERKHVAQETFLSMADRFEPPVAREGFDTLYDVVEDALGFRELRASVE